MSVVEYYYTRAYPRHVQKRSFVENNPDPPLCLRVGLSGSPEDQKAYALACEAKQEWERNGGLMTLYCPAIVQAKGALFLGRVVYTDNRGSYRTEAPIAPNEATVTAFFDYSLVHGGSIDKPVKDFTFEAYPLTAKFLHEKGKEHSIVDTDQATIMHDMLWNHSFVNVTEDWAMLDPDLQVSIIKSVKAIAQSASGDPRIQEMVCDVRAAIGA